MTPLEKKRCHIGNEYVTKAGDIIEVLDVYDDRMLIRFNYPQHDIEFKYRTPRDGMTLKNYMKRDVYGVGYLGIDFVDKSVNTEHHQRWRGMLGRCYSDAWEKKTDKSSVVEDWHSFSIFTKWLEANNNYLELNWQIDKDLLGKNLYSPESVVWLSEKMNICITNAKNSISILNERESIGVVKSVCCAYLTLIDLYHKEKHLLQPIADKKIMELILELHSIYSKYGILNF